MDEYIEREAAIRALTLHDCDSARKDGGRVCCIRSRCVREMQ